MLRTQPDADLFGTQLQIGQHNGGHCFDNGRNAQGDTSVVAAFNYQWFNLVSLKIVGLLLAGNACCGLHRKAEIDFVAVGDSAVYAACVVGGGGAALVDNGVIML